MSVPHDKAAKDEDIDITPEMIEAAIAVFDHYCMEIDLVMLQP